MAVPELAVTGACAALLAAVHLFAGRVRFLEGIPRSRVLSAAGGVSVAYVFLQVLPELAAAQERFQPSREQLLQLEQHIYLLALAGLSIFYGLERLIKTSSPDEEHSPGLFWLHLGSFAIYNSLFGYLLLRREARSSSEVFTYTAAIALHFLVNDYGLRQDHPEAYQRKGRWLLAAAVLAGWLLGTGVDLSETASNAIFALLAGGIVLNVMKEELPEERKSRFSAFLAGAAAYALVLLLWG